MIQLFIRPPFFDEWTSVTIEGESEEAVMQIAVSHLLMSQHEVEFVDEDGDRVPFQENTNG